VKLKFVRWDNDKWVDAGRSAEAFVKMNADHMRQDRHDRRSTAASKIMNGIVVLVVCWVVACVLLSLFPL
jgi:hypothetical protein